MTPTPSVATSVLLDVTRYDRALGLSRMEHQALARFALTHRDRDLVLAEAEQEGYLTRLLLPLHNASARIEGNDFHKRQSIFLLIRTCQRLGTSFWEWDDATWIKVLGTSQETFFRYHSPGNPTHLRQYTIALAYLLGCFRQITALRGVETQALAAKIFGQMQLAEVLAPLCAVHVQWGYSASREVAFCGVATEVLLLNGSSDPRQLTASFLAGLQLNNAYRRSMVYRLGRICAHLGYLAAPLPLQGGLPTEIFKQDRERGVAPEWVAWAERWFVTTTRPHTLRRNMHCDLLRVGRWLAVQHPEVTQPAQWTRELAAEFVAAVNTMCIGDYCGQLHVPLKNPGKPWSANRKHSILGVMRRVFRDFHDWGWLERRFNPVRVFATPKSIKHQIRVAPRVIADDIWAKLLWAGINLTQDDCPVQGHPRDRAGTGEATYESFYPLEMIRAITLVWLFAGLRSDEIARLRVGCTRYQGSNTDAAPDADPRVCLLDIPVHKTGRAFTKPVDALVVDALVREAIAAWERVRPQQPAVLDRKTNELVHLLFCHRAKRLSKGYINKTLIPVLCRKAGVPREDARGSISSHRARSTIASQLFNAHDPMSLFELQAWLGHQSPATTQHYVLGSPTKLAQAYQEAGYFAHNVRSIEVLIDQEVIKSGAVVNGEPWKFYDLGHGYCTYDFFDQCVHRMACAKCAYYQPKGSTQAQVLEGKTNLQRMLQVIPLGEEERAAVEDGIAAFDALQTRLENIPTPAGPTPRQLRGKLLPIVT